MRPAARRRCLLALTLAGGCGGGTASPPDGAFSDSPIGDVGDAPVSFDAGDTALDSAPANALDGGDGLACSGGWRVVYESQQDELSPGRRDLAWRDSMLFVGHSSTAYSWIFSIPEHGGTKDLLYEGRLRSFWLESDQVLYAQNYDLFSMPQAGGPPTKVLHYGDLSYDPYSGDSLFERQLDGEAIYWLHHVSELEVWRHARTGGDDVKVATISAALTAGRLADWMAQTEDRLVVSLSGAVNGPALVTVLKSGGTLSSLPAYGNSSRALAMSNAGSVLWTRGNWITDAQGSQHYSYSFAHGALDGTTPLERLTMAPGITPVRAWAARRSWYVATFEKDARNASFVTVWFIDAAGARRIGCNPVPGIDAATAIVTAGVVIPGGLYLTVVRADGTWSVAEVSNPDADVDPPILPPADGGVADAGGAGGAGGTGVCVDEGGAGGALDPGTITEFTVPSPASGPQIIVSAPDGNLWFNEVQTDLIARIAPSGCITEFPINGYPSYAADIVFGPDGNLWFTQPGIEDIGRMTTKGSQLTEFRLTSGSQPVGIVVGSDGNLWFTEAMASSIGRITLAGAITHFTTPTRFSSPDHIASGPDGNVWFCEERAVARIVPGTGVITEFPLPDGDRAGEMTFGPDGNLWIIAYPLGGSPRIVRMTMTGVFTPFVFPPATNPYDIAAGPDGNLWITEHDGNKLARLSPTTGAITEFAIPTANAGPNGITVGPDGNIWFAESSGNKIGRLSL